MSAVRVSWDVAADAAYIAVGVEPEAPCAATTVQVPSPEGGAVILEYRENRLVGIEILGASALLPAEVLAGAVRVDETDGKGD